MWRSRWTLLVREFHGKVNVIIFIIRNYEVDTLINFLFLWSKSQIHFCCSYIFGFQNDHLGWLNHFFFWFIYNVCAKICGDNFYFVLF